ncbi:GNAT family N-acetyltransferase [Halobacillus mangrovi]|uniref:GNAT family N-acetyltransferase n=1 Tax=Halobacillus mangrovi TaxID=402384 RepID=UPI001E3C9901|nr:GNAT family N-acetyltransferase [Halobacillus mangrovi]
MNELSWKKVTKRNNLLDYLLLADEDKAIVQEYINEGEMFELFCEGRSVGVCLFTFPDQQTVEIKNIAILEDYRGLGIGSNTIKIAVTYYKEKGFQQLLVGTANSSIGNFAFYQKAGFRFYDIRKDFFLTYPEPIFENGIRAIDMIVFQLPLRK